ncbi:MAG: hypothetical protein AB7G37_09920 [Solirubrobacteraceae bacterium]
MTRQARTGRRPMVVGAACALVAVAPATAAAAWPSTTTELPLKGEEHRVVAGPTAGSVAVVGAGVDGLALTAHRPGQLGWEPGQAVPAGEDDDVVLGDGGIGVVSRFADGMATVEVHHALPSGTFASLGTFTVGEEEAVSKIAVAPDGSAVAVVLGADDALRVRHRTAGGAWTEHAPAGAAPIGDVAATVRPTGVLTVAWYDLDGDLAPSTVAAATFGAAGPLRQDALASLAGSTATIDSIVAVPSRNGAPGAVWSESWEDDTAHVRGAEAGPIAGDPVTVHELEAASFDAIGLDIAATSSATRTLVRTLDPVTSTARIVALDDPACTSTTDLENGVIVERGGALVATGIRGDRLAAGTIDDSCTVGADPSPGPPVPAGARLAAATDAEGSLVVAALPYDATQPAVVAVDDRTPPTITGIDAPERVTQGRSFTMTGAAYDAWGISSLRWRLDDVAVGTGGSVSGRFADAGRGRITLRALDPSGNVARVDRDVTVVARPATNPGTAIRDDPAVPPVQIPVPPTGGAKTEARARVRSLSIRRRGGRWQVSMRVTDARRVVLSLYRERYVRPGSRSKGAIRLRRPPVCRPGSRSGSRPKTGRRGRVVMRIGSKRVTKRLPRSMERALRKRGRYSLRVVAHGAPGTKFTAARKRFTVCR